LHYFPAILLPLAGYVASPQLKAAGISGVIDGSGTSEQPSIRDDRIADMFPERLDEATT